MDQEEAALWEEEVPRYEAKLVEIHGVEGSLEARGGDRVAANGLCGRAFWDDEHGAYAVRTFEGHTVDVPEANLQDFVRAQPEKGGFDYAWPAPGQEEEFSVRLADTIRKKGYAVVQMFEGDDLRKDAMLAARERQDWMLPKPEFEESYLGRNASSRVSMLRQADPADSPVAYYDHQVKMVAAALYGVAADFLGFRPDNYRSATMLRMPLQGPEERQVLFPGPLRQSEVDEGLVEGHLDFVQRRRLCIFYVVDTRGGTMELHPREDLCQPGVLLPLSKDKVVIFRHDLMGYTYRPSGPYDLVLQSWFMEEQQKLRLDGFEGSQDGVQEALGLGSKQIVETSRQVHITAANMRMPGGMYQVDRYWSAISMSTDCFIEIPSTRWEMEPYYNPDSEQFGAQGKSVTKHSGMLGDEELLCFDNAFFGLSTAEADAWAPSQRILTEISFELLHFAGFPSLASLNKEYLGCTVAECALDFDVWHRYRESPDEWLQGQFNWGTSAARVAMIFGITGPLKQVDTACSSSLVSHNMCHAMLRKVDNKGVERMFSVGHQTCNMPWGFIGLSGAGMLGRTGRCLTFDNSGNGMARAEGCGGLYMKTTSDPTIVTERLGVYNSSFINQDGRSASLTAPNGPSQQLCMRASMKDGHLNPSDIVSNESHGTGTALGDPIETGSVRAVFRGRGEMPICVTSSKSNTGHQESTAGANGLLRTLTSLLNATIATTVHVNILNQHIEHEGFPGIFPTESYDLNRDSNVAGLNSFGFGGTNSRGELWAHAVQGARGDSTWFRQIDKRKSRTLSMDHLKQLGSVAVVCPRCAGPMCWLCGATLPAVPGQGKHHCSAVREEHASYDQCSDCYTGGYKYGGEQPVLLDAGEALYVTGTWSGWSSMEEMHEEGDGVYVAEVAMGDTCLEEFRICLGHDDQRSFFPIATCASSRARIVGPAKPQPGKNWLIDGRRDGAETGTVYRVKLELLETRRRISWERLERRVEPETVAPRHSYSVISSLESFRPAAMQRDPTDPFSWEFSGRMLGKEDTFMFQRDRDAKQLIYPLQHRPRDASVPVVGPDAGCGVGKDTRLWAVRGRPGDVVMLRLHIRDGCIRVTAISEGGGQVAWHNSQGGARERYFVKSTWSSELQELEPDMADLDVRRLQFRLPELSYEASGRFQILVNRDERRVLHPGHPDAAPGQALPEGPDADARDLQWLVNGPPGQEFELSLDLGAEDLRRMVTCRPLKRMKGLPAA